MPSKGVLDFLEEISNKEKINPYLYYENTYNHLLECFELNCMPNIEEYINRYENLNIPEPNKYTKRYNVLNNGLRIFLRLKHMFETYITHMFHQAHCNSMFRSYIKFFHREMYLFFNTIRPDIDRHFFGPEFIFSEINQ